MRGVSARGLPGWQPTGSRERGGAVSAGARRGGAPGRGILFAALRRARGDRAVRVRPGALPAAHAACVQPLGNGFRFVRAADDAPDEGSPLFPPRAGAAGRPLPGAAATREGVATLNINTGAEWVSVLRH